MAESGSVQDEVKTLGRSLSVLGVTLIGLYAIFFGVEGNSISSQVEQAMNDTGIIAEETFEPRDISQLVPEEIVQPNTQNEPEKTKSEYDMPPPIQLIELPSDDASSQRAVAPSVTGGPAQTFFSFEELFGEDGEQVEVEEVIPFSGTHQWEGVMKSLELLGLTDNAEYILKDNYNTHYVFLGEFTENIMSAVLLQGGNVVEIADKNDINQNVLFGDIVTFVNMPDFEGIKVLLLVTFKERNETRFLQVDHDIRYDIKKDLQAMFAKRYTR